MVVPTKQTCRHYSSSKNKPYVKYQILVTKIKGGPLHITQLKILPLEQLGSYLQSEVQAQFLSLKIAQIIRRKFGSQIKSSTRKDNFAMKGISKFALTDFLNYSSLTFTCDIIQYCLECQT